MAKDGEVEEGGGGAKPKEPLDEDPKEAGTATGGGEGDGPGASASGAAGAATAPSSRSSPSASASDPADWTSALLAGDGESNNNNNGGGGASPSPNSPRPGQGQQRPTVPITRPPAAAAATPLIQLPHQRAATASMGVPPGSSLSGSATGTSIASLPVGTGGVGVPAAVPVAWPRPTAGPGMVGLGGPGVGPPTQLTAPTPMQAAQLPRQPQPILMTTAVAAAASVAGTQAQPQVGAPPMQIQQQQAGAMTMPMQPQQQTQQLQQQPMQPPPARTQPPQVPPSASASSAPGSGESSGTTKVATSGAGASVAALKEKTAGGGVVATSKPAPAGPSTASSPQRQQQPQQHQNQQASSTSSSPPDPSAPVMVPGFSHPLPHLHQLFHPYVLPTDASLDAARLRLRTALDQTRLLRETFTHRVWDKYNIVLRPVETSVDEIVIRNTPSNPLGGGLEGAKERIRREAGVWSWEKRIEGIARDEMGNVVPPTPPPGSPVPSGSANPAPGSGGGGGGFSLVVLPDDPTYGDLEGRNRERCGKKISGASAAAASVLISRARSNAAARRVVFADLAREQAQARAAQAAAAAAEVKPPAVASASADAGTAGTTVTSSASASASSPQQQQQQQQQQQSTQQPKSKYPPSGPIVVHVGPDELRAAALPPSLASSSPVAAASSAAASPSGIAPTTPAATTPLSSSVPALAPCTSHDALDAVRSAAGDVAGGAVTPGPTSSSSGSRSGRSGASANLPKTVVVAPGAAAAAAAAAALQKQQPRLRVSAPATGLGGVVPGTARPQPTSPSSSLRKKTPVSSRGSPRPGGGGQPPAAASAMPAATQTQSSTQQIRPGMAGGASPSSSANATAAAAAALAVASSPAAMLTTRLTPAEIAALPHHPFPHDVSRDDKLILHHRSSGAYRGKVLRNASRSPVASRILGSGGTTATTQLASATGAGVSVPPLVKAWTTPRPAPPPVSGSPPPLTGEEADASSSPKDGDDEQPYRAARMALRCAYASRHVVPLLAAEDDVVGKKPPPQSRPPNVRGRRDQPRDGVSLPPPWRWMGQAHHIRVLDGGAKTSGDTIGRGSVSSGGDDEEARLAIGRVLDAFYGPASAMTTTTGVDGEGPEGRNRKEDAASSDVDGGIGTGGCAGSDDVDGSRPRKRLRRQDATLEDERLKYQRQDATLEDERVRYRRQDAFSLSPEPPPPEPEDGDGDGDGDGRGDEDKKKKAETGGSDEEAGAGARKLRRQDATLEDERVKYQRQDATIQDGGSSVALSSASENEQRVAMDVDMDGGGTSKDLGGTVGATTDGGSSKVKDDVVAGDDSKTAGSVAEAGGEDPSPASRHQPRPRPIYEVDMARRLRFPRHHPPRKDVDAEDVSVPKRYDDVTVYSTLVALGLVVPRSATVVRRRGRRRKRVEERGGRRPPSRWSSHLFDPILRSAPSHEADDDVIAPWFEVGEEVEAKWHPPDPKKKIDDVEARFFSKAVGDEDASGDGQRSSEENQHHEPGWYPGFITRVRRSAPPTLWDVLARKNDEHPDDSPSALLSSRVYYDVEYEDGDVDVGLPESLIRKKGIHGEGSDSEEEEDEKGDRTAGGANVPPSGTTSDKGQGHDSGPDGDGDDGRPETTAAEEARTGEIPVASMTERKRNGDPDDGDVEMEESTGPSAPAPGGADVAPRGPKTGSSLDTEDVSDEGTDDDDEFDWEPRGETYSLGVVKEYRSRFEDGEATVGGIVPPASSSPSDPDPSSSAPAPAAGGGDGSSGSKRVDITPKNDGGGEKGRTVDTTGDVEGKEGAGAQAQSSSTSTSEGVEVSSSAGTTIAAPADPPAAENSADVSQANTTAAAPPTRDGGMEGDATATGGKPPPHTPPRSAGGDRPIDANAKEAVKEEKGSARVLLPAAAPPSRGEEDPSSPSATEKSTAEPIAKKEEAVSEGVTPTAGDDEEVVTTGEEEGVVNAQTADPSASDPKAKEAATTMTEPMDVSSSQVSSPQTDEAAGSIRAGSAARKDGDDETGGKKMNMSEDSELKGEGEKEGDTQIPSKKEPDMNKRSSSAAKPGSSKRRRAPAPPRQQHGVDTAMMLHRGPLGMEDLLAGRGGTTTTSGVVLPASVPSSSSGGLEMPPPPLPPQRAHTTGSSAGLGTPSAGMVPSSSAWGAGVGVGVGSLSSATGVAAAQTGEPYLTQLAAAHSAAAAAEAAAAARYQGATGATTSQLDLLDAARYPATGATTSQQQLDLLDAIEGRRARAAAALSASASPSRLPPQAAAAAALYPSQNAPTGLSPAHSVQFSAAAARAAASYDDPYASAATALYLEDLAAARSSLAAATYEYNALVRQAQQRQQEERRIREHAAAIAAAVNPGIDPLLHSPYDAWATGAQSGMAGLSPQAARQLALLQAAGGQRQRPSSANAAVHYSSTYGDNAGVASALLGSVHGGSTGRPRPSSASTLHQRMRQLEPQHQHQRPSTAMAAVSTGELMNMHEHLQRQHHHRHGGGMASSSVHHRGLLHQGYDNSPGAVLPGGAGATEAAGIPMPPTTHPMDAALAAALHHGIRPSSAGARLTSLSSSPHTQQKRTTGRRQQQQQRTRARPTSSGGGGDVVAPRDVAAVGGSESAKVHGRRTAVGGPARNADVATEVPLSAPTDDDEKDKTPIDKGEDDAAAGDDPIGKKKDGDGDGSAASESETNAPPDTSASTGGDDDFVVPPSSSDRGRSEADAATTKTDRKNEDPGPSGDLVATSTTEEGAARAEASDTKVVSSSSSPSPGDVGVVANLAASGGGSATESINNSVEAEVAADGDEAEKKDPSSVEKPFTIRSKNVESSTSNAGTTTSSCGPSASASDKPASVGSAPGEKSSPGEDTAAPLAITRNSSDGAKNAGPEGGSDGSDHRPHHPDNADGGNTTGTRLLRTFVAPRAPSELESDYPTVARQIRMGTFPSDLRSALRRGRRRRRHHPPRAAAGGGEGADGATDASRKRTAAGVDVESSAPTEEVQLPPPEHANGDAPSSSDAPISTEPMDADVEAVRAENAPSAARTEEEEATFARLEGMCLDYLLKVAEAISFLFSPPRDGTWIIDEMVRWCSSRRASPSPVVGGDNSDMLAMKGLKEVLNAIVTIWLWRQLERCASSSSTAGTSNYHPAKVISVDSEECMFMMKRTVDTALRAVSDALDDDDYEGDGGGGTYSSRTVQVAAKVCDSLGRALCVDRNVDEALLHLSRLVRHLEARRRIALHLMLYERALLATYLSFTLTMSDGFSNAYVASLIVAGEALGHDEVCDLVRDDMCGVCTMLPYDRVPGQNHHLNRDPSLEWEDPCRPTASYASGLNAVELTRRAHARAQVHRSLFKLQEKHGFQGGTPNAGPYDETPAPNDPSSAALTPTATAGGSTPRGGASGLKRKSSFTGREIDATGGATHSGALQYPAHYCAPLVIQKDDINFLPYGRHTQQVRSDSSPSAKRARVSVEPPSSKEDHVTSSDTAMDLVRSTEPIDWLDVAKMFQPVALPDQSAASTVAAGSQVGTSAGKSAGVEGMPKIFAPVVRQLNKRTSEPFDSLSDTEEEDDDDSLEEDISDDAVLSRHQAVLDHMKEKLDVAMGQRNNRSRSFGGTAPARASASAR